MNTKLKTTLKRHKNNKMEYTDDIRKRIKELQNERGYTSNEIAALLDVTYYKYKNIVDGKNLYIDPVFINSLSDIYDCTADYILCTSNEKDLDKNGIKKVHPLSFDEANQKLAEITNFLHHDYQTLNNLHLLLFKLPLSIRDDLLSSLNSICKIIRITTLSDRKDKLTKEKLDYIMDTLISDNEELTKMTIKLAEADEHLSKKRRTKALHIYLEIILYSSFQSASAANKAIWAVKNLSEIWGNFPRELIPLIELLPKLQASNYFNYPCEIEKIIFDYLTAQHKSPNFKLKSRAEYFFF